MLDTIPRQKETYTNSNSDKSTRIRKALNNKETVIAEYCKRSLFYFVRTFWYEIAADKPEWNWHIPYICGQLMQIATRVGNNQKKKNDLIVNIPPGTTKSTLCSVMFPAWCWINWPWMRFITSSYSGALSLELAEYSRDLVRSTKFKQLFPHLEIKQDKDTKSNFRIQQRFFDANGNIAYVKPGGNRYSTSVGGTLTGFHGHILLVDDPLDPNRAVSETELKSANRWIDQTLSTRKVNKSITPTILIMQRLHQNDPTGHLLAKKKKNLFRICLPGEIKHYEDKVQPEYLKKYYKNKLLDPKRMPWSVMKDLEADLGQYGYAGQVGQDPSPPGGGMFKVEHFHYVDHMPSDVNIIKTVRYWDKAGSQDTGAHTVGVKMHELRSGKMLISDVKRGQWSSEKREQIIKETAEADGVDCYIYTEQEPGSGGKESAESTIRNLSGFNVQADRPTGDKIYRADPYSVQVNNGNILLLKGEWNQEFIEEHRFFPYGTYKDQVDAASGAFNKLKGKRTARPVLGNRRR